MAIEFQCHHCGNKVKTSEEHAGKRGRCPHCKNSVYIPTPSEALDIIPLVPIDEEHEREKEQLAADAQNLSQQIRSDKTNVPEDTSDIPMPEPTATSGLKPDVETLIIDYVLAMAEGNLDEAEDYAKDIRANMDEAEEIIERISNDDIMPRQLHRVPRAVMIGFLKQLS
jgi:hypothetical protein